MESILKNTDPDQIVKTYFLIPSLGGRGTGGGCMLPDEGGQQGEVMEGHSGKQGYGRRFANPCGQEVVGLKYLWQSFSTLAPLTFEPDRSL